MGALFDPQTIQAKALELKDWLLQDILVLSTLGQFVVIGLCFAAAHYIEPRTKKWIESVARGRRYEVGVRKVASALAPLTVPVIWLILQWLFVYIAIAAEWPHHLNTTVVSLLTAWVIIRLTSTLVRDPVWAKAVAVSAWTVAALNILNLLDPTIALLDGLSISLADMRISALTVLKGVFTLAVLLWVASAATRLLEKRIKGLNNLTPSVQVLFGKLLKISLLVVAVIVAMDTVGIDLGAFALFGGAIGVGIGFGLQKVVSNLISGVILLLDKSIKPGDVVTVGDTYGWINSLGARYVSVITRDGMEHLIPNEILITEQVINWSFTDRKVRMRCRIGVSYQSDIHRAMALTIEAAREVPRVMATPDPVCQLLGFGDNSVDLELRFWISDPQNGTANVRSQVLLLVWDKFHAEGIEFPFPQRDVHLTSVPEIGVRVTQAAKAPARRTPTRKARQPKPED